MLIQPTAWLSWVKLPPGLQSQLAVEYQFTVVNQLSTTRVSSVSVASLPPAVRKLNRLPCQRRQRARSCIQRQRLKQADQPH
jgi:hypothetical protein